jgi:hypothetical protein
VPDDRDCARGADGRRRSRGCLCPEAALPSQPKAPARLPLVRETRSQLTARSALACRARRAPGLLAVGAPVRGKAIVRPRTSAASKESSGSEFSAVSRCCRVAPGAVTC